MSNLDYKPLLDNYSFLSLTYKEKNKTKRNEEPHYVVDVLDEVGLDSFLTDVDEILLNVQYWKDKFESPEYLRLFIHQRVVPWRDTAECSYYLLGERLETEEELSLRLKLEAEEIANRAQLEKEFAEEKLAKERLAYERLKKKFEGT